MKLTSGWFMKFTPNRFMKLTSEYFYEIALHNNFFAKFYLNFVSLLIFCLFQLPIIVIVRFLVAAGAVVVAVVGLLIAVGHLQKLVFSYFYFWSLFEQSSAVEALELNKCIIQ